MSRSRTIIRKGDGGAKQWIADSRGGICLQLKVVAICQTFVRVFNLLDNDISFRGGPILPVVVG